MQIGGQKSTQWRPVHKKHTTSNPAVRPQDVHWFLVWERHAVHRKTIETQETQGTLEANRAFLGMSLHCTLELVKRLLMFHRERDHGLLQPVEATCGFERRNFGVVMKCLQMRRPWGRKEA
eukprot:2623301-Pyramimonas_sp.AAC.1